MLRQCAMGIRYALKIILLRVTLSSVTRTSYLFFLLPPPLLNLFSTNENCITILVKEVVEISDCSTAGLSHELYWSRGMRYWRLQLSITGWLVCAAERKLWRRFVSYSPMPMSSPMCTNQRQFLRQLKSIESALHLSKNYPAQFAVTGAICLWCQSRLNNSIWRTMT